MAKIPDGSFQIWKNGETIVAQEYVKEREMLRVAINDIEDRVVGVEDDVEAVGLGNAQLSKITNDEGGVKISVSNTTGDILARIVEEGVGFHTFYAVTGSRNLPPSDVSIRGMAHITSVGHGWVVAMDYNNNLFTNYLANEKWTGWREYANNNQNALWTGMMHPNGSQTIRPTKELTNCKTGWILVWSDFDPGASYNNFDFHYTHVPKFIASRHNGAQHLFSIPRSPDAIVVKKVNIFNDRITGYDENQLPGPNDTCLRYILEY